MAISLQKGGNVNLSKEAPDLSDVAIGLGWDIRSTDGAAYDLDASAFMLTASGKVRADNDFIFYGNKKSIDGSIEHLGDNITGAGDGDDEVIEIKLKQVPTGIEKVAISVTIHDADARRQNFGQVSSAFIRVVNKADNRELARYDLSEDSSTETALIFGEIYRAGSEWKFRAVGQGFKGGLAPLARNFGVNVA
jgi:tellurium resistance protein TerD